MEVCNIFLNNLNTFLKELYTYICVTLQRNFFFFWVKILPNVANNKDKKKL